MVDVREDVISKIVAAMSPTMDVIHLQMLEGAVRGALHGIKLEEECTELSTQLDNTWHVLQCFAANKKLEGCKEKTLEQYLRTAKKFFGTIGKGYKDITKDDARYYLAMRAPLVGPNTLVNEKRNLSSLFSWLHDEGYIPKNPLKNIKLTGKDTEIIYFTVQEEIAIREATCNLRDKAMIAFLFSTGVRVGELAAMDRNNVDLLNASVTFRGEKGRTGRVRTVYLDAWARWYLGQYLKARNDENPALFVSERIYDGKPRRLGNAAIEKITKGITARAGVDKVGTVHVFRRTFATRCVERGMAIEVVQELMGHADPATTLKYYVAKAGLRIKAEWEKHVLCAA